MGHVAQTQNHRDHEFDRKIQDRAELARDEQDNEFWHLLIMEELSERSGYRRRWFLDKVFPQVLSFIYYHLSWLLYVLNPKWSYKLNSDFEDHAMREYARFVEEHPEFDEMPWESKYRGDYGFHATVGDMLRQVAGRGTAQGPLGRLHPARRPVLPAHGLTQVVLVPLLSTGAHATLPSVTDDRPDTGSAHEDGADTTTSAATALDESPEPDGRPPRWWPLGLGVASVLVVGWAFATAWVGIMGSSPAYLITLLLALALAIGLIAWSVLVGTPPHRTPGRTWLARGGLLPGGAVLIGLLVYLRPLSADQIAVDALDDGGGVTVDVSRSAIRLTPDAEPRTVGLAFYPGAKVDPQAYAHILRPIAEAGFPVVILKQPYNLAILDSDAADAVIGDPDDAIDDWAVAGHSLGGAMASRYAEQQRDELTGLLFWAAWPVVDMSDRSHLAVMSVFGTADEIADPADIVERMPDLPTTTEYVAIDGAIHSFFGDYGLQRGDGTPGVSRADAQRGIAEASIGLLEAIERR